MVRRIRPTEGRHLRDVRLRALQSDPEAFGSSYELEGALSEVAWDQRAASSASGGVECVFVAEGRPALIGMVGAYTPAEAGTVRHLYGLWVAPEARGTGAGQALVDQVIAWSEQAGATEVQLWVVTANLGARRLYQRSGFVETGFEQALPSNSSLTEILVTLPLR